MKRYGNLFCKIADIDNIRLAHKNARKGKTKYDEVKVVDADEEIHCQEILELLLARKFKCSHYEMFIKKDGGKEREIFKLPYFPDRIIQHAIMQIVEPIWKKTLIADTYQAIRGRGVHKCMRKMRKVIQVDKVQYCLQTDVRKFYPSIDNKLLKLVVRKKLKCKLTLELINEIIDGHIGVPIGNYISQYFGNLFLSELDHLIKEVYGIKNYFRYCDDILILHNDKTKLHELRAVIEHWLSRHKLGLKGDYQIYKISRRRGVDCFGYIIRHDGMRVRNSITKAFKSACKQPSVLSITAYFGWFLPTRDTRLWKKYAVGTFLQHNESHKPIVRKLLCKLERN